MKNLVYDSEWSTENYFALDDEISNLKFAQVKGKILVIADLGLWDGRKTGYREIRTKSVSDVFSAFQGDSFRLYVEDGELKGEDCHHDGTNFYVFKEVVDESLLDEIEGLIYSGNEIPVDLEEKTLGSLGKKVSEIYGW